MGLVKAELKRLEDSGAACVEIIEGEYKGVIGILFDYYETQLAWSQVTVFATDNKEYIVGKDEAKLISVDDFIEKAGWKG